MSLITIARDLWNAIGAKTLAESITPAMVNEAAQAVIDAVEDIPAGAQGIQGVPGDAGAQGIQGIQGDKGDKGDKGDTGDKGDKGDKGDTGASGNTVESFGFALGAATADATAITIPISLPYAFTIISIFCELGVAATGSRFTVDIQKNGVSIFSTLLTFDSGEVSTLTSSIAYVLASNPTSFTTSDILTAIITQVGAVTAGQAPTLWLIGSKTI